LGKRKILIVDDNEELRSGIRQAFAAKFSHELYEAKNGLEGLVRAKQVNPDVVLLDYMMPGMDGNQFLRHLRDEPKLRECKVIVMTGEHTMEDVKLFADLRISGYVVKPFLLDDIIERVEKILGNGNSSGASRAKG
jgi:two-component system alkaline phosphatase synthesis response regulator PhoP